MVYKDQLDRTITINAIPKRIISLVPSQTELLSYLGLDSSIIGVTKFCVHPKSLRKQKTIVGGTKNVNLEKISALEPDLIICNKEENTKQIVDSCSKIAPVWVSDISTLEQNNIMIALLGDLLNKKKEANILLKEIEKEHLDFMEFVSAKPLVKVAYCIWKKPFMVAGGATFINSLLKMSKFVNVFENRESRYTEVDFNEFNEAEVLFLSSEPYPFKDADVIKLKNELQCEVRLVDGEYFSWYGSRIKNAFKYFRILRS